MKFDDTCVRCGSQLDHVDTDGGPRPDSETTHHHYRCPDDGCLADGGTVVVAADGTIQRTVGPAVDAAHSNPRLQRGEK